ncbi:PilT/PilU family type 4a pilus ATPase [Pseudomaricurvus alkylphenolicus]|uniref:PilT/PilU family type 4a pilus ATPase n=1 Tax=Pseudomaricurvus alkylphenolicus TaxID=1306991 RepID=UPI001423D1C8|nr:PilT/PilU family type 4a pilus ATPase [Pseudomaricurvus alkylphenolicus]NIB42935.1 PilT/PilU family type 4a pilus ATPase [Pseudomaricurvus alkylphenolicus]
MIENRQLDNVLALMARESATDLYITVGAPLILNVSGKHRLMGKPLTRANLEAVVRSVTNEAQREQYERDLELDIGLNLDGVGRFRINIYQQKSNPALVVRYVNSKIPTLEELNLPEVLHDLVMEKQGLILVVGMAGSGKSTTLASMLDYRIQNHFGHLLTVEDPIEFEHQHHRSIVSQREVGIDTHSFQQALKQAMREAPDAIMLGEIREHETASQLLHYAQSGHLCLSTLHASNTTAAIDRFLNLFPSEYQHQKRLELSDNLLAIIGLRLVPATAGGRVAASEVMLNTSLIRKYLEESETAKIREAMSGVEAGGCHTFDDCLFNLIDQGKVSRKEALKMADSRQNLRIKLKSGVQAEPHRKQGPEYWLKPDAEFEHFNTIVVSRKLGNRDRRPEVTELLQQAVTHACQDRGYQVMDRDSIDAGESPDLLLKYAYGLRHRQDINIDGLEAGDEEEMDAGLAIKIKDNATGETIWHLTYHLDLSRGLPDRKELEVLLSGAFASLPFAGVAMV